MLDKLAELALKIFNYLDLSRAILGVLSTQLKPAVTTFIDAVMATWQVVLDAMDEGDEKEAKKVEAHNDVVAKTQAEFSESPSWIPEWVISVYIKARIGNRDNDKAASDKAITKGLFVNPKNVDENVQNMKDLGIG